MRLYSEYRAMAREKMEGRWSDGVLMTLIIVVLTVVCTSPSYIFPFLELNDMTSAVFGSANSGLSTLISLLVIAPLEFAMYNALLAMARGTLEETQRPVEAMFSFFKMDWVRYVKAIILELVIIIPVSLITLGIGGIILSYAYKAVPFLMRDYPEIGAREALKLSRELMKGHKWDLFVLQFTFIGWMILSVLTAGIGFLWLIPYQSTAEALFYQDLKDAQIVEE